MASPELGHKHIYDADGIHRILAGGQNRWEQTLESFGQLRSSDFRPFSEKLHSPHQLACKAISWSNGYIHKTAQSMREVLFDEVPNSPTYRFITFFVLATASAATVFALSELPVVQNTARSLLENAQNFSQLIK